MFAFIVHLLLYRWFLCFGKCRDFGIWGSLLLLQSLWSCSGFSTPFCFFYSAFCFDDSSFQRAFVWCERALSGSGRAFATLRRCKISASPYLRLFVFDIFVLYQIHLFCRKSATLSCPIWQSSFPNDLNFVIIFVSFCLSWSLLFFLRFFLWNNLFFAGFLFFSFYLPP